jgi:hypothetical protein
VPVPTCAVMAISVHRRLFILVPKELHPPLHRVVWVHLWAQRIRTAQKVIHVARPVIPRMDNL